MLAIALQPGQIAEIIGIVSFLCSVIFALATYNLTNKYGVRFQRRLDRIHYLDANFDARLSDVEGYLKKTTSFFPRERLNRENLPPEDTDFI